MQSSKLGLGGSMLAGKAVRGPARLAFCRRRHAAVTRAVAEPQAVPFLSTADHLERWTPQSWRNFTALQQPAYPDQVPYHAPLNPVRPMHWVFWPSGAAYRGRSGRRKGIENMY